MMTNKLPGSNEFHEANIFGFINDHHHYCDDQDLNHYDHVHYHYNEDIDYGKRG